MSAIQRRGASDVAHYLRDLHARELMRLGLYRHFSGGEAVRSLRARKDQHQAFLRDLLRRRNLRPVWYARLFLLAGHIFGWALAFAPRSHRAAIQRTLEWWILLRYERYLRKLKLHSGMRSMIEALQMARLQHNEPGVDVLQLLEQFSAQQRVWLSGAFTPAGADEIPA